MPRSRTETSELHVHIRKEVYDKVRMLCVRQGDLTMHVEAALTFYLETKGDFIEKVRELREELDKMNEKKGGEGE